MTHIDPEEIERIIASVCYLHGVTRLELLSRRRQAHLVNARQDCVARLRKLGMTFKHIGNVMNRDHTSIMHLDKRRVK